MNSKAQLSIDAIIALIALMVFASFFSSFNESFTESSDKAFILRQEKMIAESIQDIIMIANSSDKITLTYFVPPIIDPISKKERSCEINFNSNEMTISFDYGYPTKETIEYKKTLINDGISLSNVKCNSIFMVSK